MRQLVESVLAYVLTVVGILLSAYVPMLKSSGHIDVRLNWWRVVIAALVAVLVVAAQESDERRGSKRHKTWNKMANALAHGVAWAQIMSMA